MHDGQPCFVFTVDIQEFSAKINVKDGSPYFWTPAKDEQYME